MIARRRADSSCQLIPIRGYRGSPPSQPTRLLLLRRHTGRRDYYASSHRAMTAQSVVPATSATIHGSAWDFQ